METEELRQQLHSALKREKVLRDFVYAVKTMPYTLNSDYPEIRTELANWELIQNFIRNIEATPTPSNLAVVSLEELRTWPCGCFTLKSDGILYHLTFKNEFTEGKCPRCKLIAEMESHV